VLKRVSLLIGFCLLIGILGPAAHAQTVNAASCNASDVQTALSSVNQATATVVIPAGVCSWSSALSYTVPSGVTSLTIQGQTTVSCTGTAGTSSYACTATDNTVLIDSYSADNQAIWNINVGGASVFFRLTGLTFQGGTLPTGVTKPNGFIKFTGSTQSLRVDHDHFNAQSYGANVGGGVTIYSDMNGVFDHNVFNLVYQNNGVRYYPESTGDTDWSQPSQLGSSDFIFIENNIFSGGFANDCQYGGREVIRYNTVEADVDDASGDSGAIQTHATSQGAPRARGCRAEEKYHNYIYDPTPTYTEYTAGDGNSGTGVSWGNTISTGYSYDIGFEEIRVLAGNNCGGTNCPTPPASFGYCGSGSSGVLSAWDGNTNSSGYPCLDQTGRGESDLLNNAAFPGAADTVTGTQSWPHNLLEPWYVWNETVASGNVCTNQTLSGVQMQANRDFYCQVSASPNTSTTSPFNGSTGTGFGLFAYRPTTCTAGLGGTYDQSPTGSYGVAYWATDTNTLYVCTSTNAWTAVYTPYTYPHPLTAGTVSTSGNAPNPPTGLIATVQ
jgi:hypothetical protein